MITKSDIIVLENWAKSTRFPLRREGITSKYMKYDPSVCYIKFGKNKKVYRDKLITNEVKNIIEDDKIYGVAFITYPPKLVAKPHRDFNLWGKQFRRIQLPLKIPTGKKCYIEWLDTKEKIYWVQSKIEIFNVEKLHRGANESDESMEFLYIDVDPDIEVEL
tara:strand:- start:381 stop:866 length:486 start_codon:yes stop_codon:yes gene_type:complete